MWDVISGHENILPLFGYLLDGPIGCPSLIAEWTPDGTVMDYLAVYPETDLTPLVSPGILPNLYRMLILFMVKVPWHSKRSCMHAFMGRDTRKRQAGWHTLLIIKSNLLTLVVTGKYPNEG